MSYRISARIFQRDPSRGLFRIVEQTVFHYANGGTWSEAEGVITLTMGGSGTSGVMRLISDQNELIAIALGVHNYKRWCDIVTELKPQQTALVLNPEYYDNGPRARVREEQLAEYSVTSAVGTKVQVVFYVAEGNNLQCNVIIG